MSDTNEAKTIVLGFLEAMGKGEWERVHDEFLTDETTWTMMAPSLAIPPMKGRQAIVGFFADADKAFEGGNGPTLEIVRVVAEGNAVAVESTGAGRLVNGVEYANRYHFAYETRDRRITAVREYQDSHFIAGLMSEFGGS